MVKVKLCAVCEARLRDKHGGSAVYIPAGREAVKPEDVHQLRRRGCTISAIAKRLGRSERRIYQVIAGA